MEHYGRVRFWKGNKMPESLYNKGLKWEWEIETVAPDWELRWGDSSLLVCSCSGKSTWDIASAPCSWGGGGRGKSLREQVWLSCHRFSLLLLRLVHFCERMLLFFPNCTVSLGQFPETLLDCFIYRFNQINLRFARERVHHVPYSTILEVTTPSHSTAWFLDKLHPV